MAACAAGNPRAYVRDASGRLEPGSPYRQAGRTGLQQFAGLRQRRLRGGASQRGAPRPRQPDHEIRRRAFSACGKSACRGPRTVLAVYHRYADERSPFYADPPGSCRNSRRPLHHRQRSLDVPGAGGKAPDAVRAGLSLFLRRRRPGDRAGVSRHVRRVPQRPLCRRRRRRLHQLPDGRTAVSNVL